MSDEPRDIEQKIEELLPKYLLGVMTVEESEEFKRICALKPALRLALEQIENEQFVKDQLACRHRGRQQQDLNAALAGLHAEAAPAGQKTPLIRKMIYVAAAVALVAVIGTVWIKSMSKAPEPSKTQVASEEPAAKNPVVIGAKLTFSDGASVQLNKVPNGNIANAEGSTIIKAEEGYIRYAGSNPSRTAALQYNKLETPRGYQYSITLPDRSRVWLNSASSLRYPTAFTGDKRVVELEGEAYFEIAANPGQPFFVHVLKPNEDLNVEVLGTSFNIAAYANEPDIRTTLLTGRVQVPLKDQKVVLKEDQQLIVKENGKWRHLKNVNVTSDTAWKNKVFVFDQDSLPHVMRQVARQYDKELMIDGPLQTHIYTSILPYSMPLPSLLLKLSDSSKRFHYNIEPAKIIISY